MKTENDILLIAIEGVFVATIDKWVEFNVCVYVIGILRINIFTYKSLITAAGS